MKLGSSKRLLFSFLIAAVLFASCLVLIKDMAVQEETAFVLVTDANIPEGKKITDMTVGIIAKEIPISLIPAKAVRDLSQIEDLFTVCEVGKGQILTEYFFTDKKAMSENLKEPVEVSVGVSNMDQIVGGVLREGDLVNISVVIEEKEEGENVYHTLPVVSKAYVSRTFTNGGAFVPSEDKEQTAMVINVLIEASEEEEFHAALSEGKIRISLICD